VSLVGERPSEIFINKPLIKNYLADLARIKEQFKIKDEITLDTLIHLPGVLSLMPSPASGGLVWPALKTLISSAVEALDKTRQKEGLALYRYLKNRAQGLVQDLNNVHSRFKKVIMDKLSSIDTDEERAAFLKDTDITEEIERLSFHSRNLLKKLRQNGSIGKELDFIAQEMQREANTMAAKSCDGMVSSRVIKIKSQIEKIREQLQNVE
jgi:uncharacterized protein (TIGR00255 family)